MPLLESELVNFDYEKYEKRFWKKVDKRSETECWPWTAGLQDGYGHFYFGKRQLYASRASWIFRNRRMPTGVICHHCDNPICVNPAHLYDGTMRDNMADKITRGRAKHPKGSQHQFSKLTEEVVVSIRARVASGERQRAIANELGLHYNTVNSAVTGASWRHVA